MVKISSRKQLTESEREHMKTLLLKEGPNEWNYLTEESVTTQFDYIQNGNALVVIAEDDNDDNNDNDNDKSKIVGFAVLILGAACPAKLSKYHQASLLNNNNNNVAYINDVVVAKKMAGQGVGTRLLLECVSIVIDASSTTRGGESENNHGTAAVYIERHEENAASAGMMRNAGFELVETIFDPAKRRSGSRKTSILVKRLKL